MFVEEGIKPGTLRIMTVCKKKVEVKGGKYMEYDDGSKIAFRKDKAVAKGICEVAVHKYSHREKQAGGASAVSECRTET